jgi:hypothetical protein
MKVLGKHGRNLLILAIGSSLCVTVITGRQKGLQTGNRFRTAPLIRGTLWYIAQDQMRTSWQKKDFAREIQYQIDIGFDLLWLLNTPALMEEAIAAEAKGKPRDVLEMIFQIADENRMRVMFDLPQTGWYGKTTPHQMIGRSKAHIERFFERYGRHRSFYGWYLNYEINPIHPSEQNESRFWRLAWKGIVAECHRVAPNTVVTISPFFLLDRQSLRGFAYLEPKAYERWWSATLAETEIDILMLQDSGEHLGFFTLEQREPFFAAFAKACRQAKTRFWINVETGEEDVNDWGEYFTNVQRRQEPWDYWRFTPIEWLEKKLCLAASYAENIVNWGYYPFMTPNPLPSEELPARQAAYEAYKAYFHRTANRCGNCAPRSSSLKCQ